MHGPSTCIHSQCPPRKTNCRQIPHRICHPAAGSQSAALRMDNLKYLGHLWYDQHTKTDSSFSWAAWWAFMTHFPYTIRYFISLYIFGAGCSIFGFLSSQKNTMDVFSDGPSRASWPSVGWCQARYPTSWPCAGGPTQTCFSMRGRAKPVLRMVDTRGNPRCHQVHAMEIRGNTTEIR